MSNAWCIVESTPEDVLDFLFADPRFYLGVQDKKGRRPIRIEASDGCSHTVGFIKYTTSKCEMEWEGGGPSPWRDINIVPCPIGMKITEKCPVCGGTQASGHLKVSDHHPIFRFAEKV